jgi:predicted molibdopterin-dependent oxidoreductase YjgC
LQKCDQSSSGSATGACSEDLLEQLDAVINVNEWEEHSVNHKHDCSHDQSNWEVSNSTHKVVEPLQMLKFALEKEHHPVKGQQKDIKGLGRLKDATILVVELHRRHHL